MLYRWILQNCNFFKLLFKEEYIFRMKEFNIFLCGYRYTIQANLLMFYLILTPSGLTEMPIILIEEKTLELLKLLVSCYATQWEVINYTV